jgi:hypothetical protein
MSGKRTAADREDHQNFRQNKRDGTTMEQESDQTDNQNELVFEDPFGDEYEEEDVYEDDENDIDDEEEEKSDLKASGNSSQAYVKFFDSKEKLIERFSIGVFGEPEWILLKKVKH